MSGPYSLGDLTRPAGPPPRRGVSPAVIVAIVAGAGLLVLCLCGTVGYVYVEGQRVGTSASRAPAVAAPPTTRADPPAAPTPDKPEVMTVPLGQEIVMTSRGLGSKDTTKWTVSADKTYSRSPKFSVKPERGIFLGVRLSVEVTEGSNYIYAGDIALIAADGTAFETKGGFGFDGAFEGIELQAGQKSSGLVIFDVPQAALTGARIQLRDGGYNPDSDQVYWQL